MLLFSINRSRGYENPSLEIIVTERCLIGGCPLEEAYEHFFLNQTVISVVVLISFLCYCGDYTGYITIILPFLAFYFSSAYLLYLVSCKWYQSTFLGKNYGNFFSRVETYSNVFKPQRSIITCISPWLRDSYMQELQVVLKLTSVGHPCNPCWYPFEW